MIRLQWIDSLRGLLILLVILGHSIQFAPGMDCEHDHLWNLISSFHVPTFMFLSGYLNYRSVQVGRFSYAKRRFQQLFIPCIIWTIIASVLAFPDCINKFKQIIMYPDYGFWFLWALFWITIIFIVVDYLSERLKRNM